MKVEQLYTGCLSEAAYYIESEGEAAIIDPMRETAPYIQRAAIDGAVIKYIFETHFHADFVSGHLELSKKTQAPIVYGAEAKCGFDCILATDGQEFKVGKLTIRALHTPGHTLESTTYLLLDESGHPYCIFTGDTLFIGDVGRPDLAISNGLTMEQLAGHLYESIHHKILPLPDSLIVYPAHGAGSACGKNLSKETFDTLGHQRFTNYALQPMSKAHFVQTVTEGLSPAPQYFPKNALLNQSGAGSLDTVIMNGVKALNPLDFATLTTDGVTLILDTRSPAIFAHGHIPNAINIGLDGQFAPWVGALIIDLAQPIAIVCEDGRAEETVMRLARVGYDHTVGYLDGGIAAWIAAGMDIAKITSITAKAFESQYQVGETLVLDVRRPSEYDRAHINNALNRPLEYIRDWADTLQPDQTYYIHCAGGYRSMVAASILAARGIIHLTDIAGGYSAISETKLPQVPATLSTTM